MSAAPTDPPVGWSFAQDVVDAFAEDRSRIALVWEDERGDGGVLSFWDIRERSRRVATALARRGLSEGDRVVVALRDGPERRVAIVAALRLGAAIVTSEPEAEPGRVDGIVAAVGARALIFDRTTLAGVGQAVAIRVSSGIPCDRALSWQDLEDEEPLVETIEKHGGRECLVTCDIVGAGAQVSRQGPDFLLVQRLAAARWLDLRRTDLHWSLDVGVGANAAARDFGPWMLGTPVFSYRGALDDWKVLDLLARHQVTTFAARPARFDGMLAAGRPREKLTRLRHCAASGGVLSEATQRAWKALTGRSIHAAYANLDGGVLLANRRHTPIRPGSVGSPIVDGEIRIVGAGDRECPAGETGELVVAASSRALGLDTRASSGLHRTGDRGHRDGRGSFWVVT